MDKINELKIRIENIFNEELTMEKLNELKVEYLGKKGYITELNSMIKELPNEEKKEFGKNVNELRNLLYKMKVKIAYNLDGGSSSIMNYKGKTINKPSSKNSLGRYLPNAFIAKFASDVENN